MLNKHNKLKMLPVNKTVVFNSPLEGEEDVLCRTGTIAEGSCFFHSLLQAISKEYQTMDTRNKTNCVSKLRKKIASKFDENSWEKISDGVLSKISYQEKVSMNFNDVYLYFSKNKIKHKQTKDLLKQILEKFSQEDNRLIIELVTLDNLERNILPKSYEESENENIEECNEMIVKNAVDFLLKRPEFRNLEEEKSDYLIKVLISMFLFILKISKKQAYEEYISNMKDVNEDVDSFTLSIISDKFNRDIYFIDGETRLPYNNASTTQNLKKRKSIIILWVGRNHYEVIGRLLPNNVVQREFKPTDILIDKMYTYLIEPSNIYNKYPDLEPYIPKDYHKKRSPNPFKYAYLSDSSEKDESSEESDDSSESKYDTGYHRSSSRRSVMKRNSI